MSSLSRFRVLAAALMLELAGGSIYIVSLYLHELEKLWFPGDPDALEKIQSLTFSAALGNCACTRDSNPHPLCLRGALAFFSQGYRCRGSSTTGAMEGHETQCSQHASSRLSATVGCGCAACTSQMVATAIRPGCGSCVLSGFAGGTAAATSTLRRWPRRPRTLRASEAPPLASSRPSVRVPVPPRASAHGLGPRR